MTWDAKLYALRYPNQQASGVNASDCGLCGKALSSPRSDACVSILDTTASGFRLGQFGKDSPSSDTPVSSSPQAARPQPGGESKVFFERDRSPTVFSPSRSVMAKNSGLAIAKTDVSEADFAEAHGHPVPPLRLSILQKRTWNDSKATGQGLSSTVTLSPRSDVDWESSTDGRVSLPTKATSTPSVSGTTSIAVGRGSFAEVFAAQVQELRQRLEQEVRNRETWERRAQDAESTASRLAADLEKRIDFTTEKAMKAQLAAARHSLEHARSEAAQARQDADLAWHQVDAARNDAALIQEALQNVGPSVVPLDGAPDLSDQLRAKDHQIDQLQEEIRLLVAALEGSEEATLASRGLEDDVVKLRKENADLRNQLNSALASAASLQHARDADGCVSTVDGSQTETAKTQREQEQLHAYLVQLQQRLFELEHHSGMPESERVRELENHLSDMRKQSNKMTAFIEMFLFKAHRQLCLIDKVCTELVKTFEDGMLEVMEVPLMFDPKANDIPSSMANILIHLRFFVQVLRQLPERRLRPT